MIEVTVDMERSKRGGKVSVTMGLATRGRARAHVVSDAQAILAGAGRRPISQRLVTSGGSDVAAIDDTCCELPYHAA